MLGDFFQEYAQVFITDRRHDDAEAAGRLVGALNRYNVGVGESLQDIDFLLDHGQQPFCSGTGDID